MDVAERELQVRRFIDEVWNGRNYEAASELYGESYVNPFGTGPSARVEPIRRYHQAFSDLRFDVDELVVAGDTVVLRATIRGAEQVGFWVGPRPGGRSRIGSWPSCTSRRTKSPANGSAPTISAFSSSSACSTTRGRPRTRTWPVLWPRSITSIAPRDTQLACQASSDFVEGT